MLMIFGRIRFARFTAFPAIVICGFLFHHSCGYALSPLRIPNLELIIHHEKGEIGLVANQKNGLSKLLEDMLRKCQTISSANIFSVSSERDDIDENKKIGQVRAIAVKDYLKRIGLAGVPISIEVKGYGVSDIETIAEFRKTRTLIELSCVTVYPVSIFEPQ